MQVAIYARVSTERQEREQTIESQLALLQTWAQAQGHTLNPEHIFADEGYSGSRLDRPGLDALRDAAREAAFRAGAVLSPDRLARKYAYQVLLLEELRGAGCEVLFLQHPISDDPNDQLLLQIQGAIAEYERALLAERFRRGKLQKARAGQYLGGKAPYGYRYAPKREGVPGHLVVDEAEAELVRTLYRWLVDERLTLRQILKRLDFGPWYPRSGKRPWSSSTVHHILADPVYAGTAYANRYRYVSPKKPRAARGPRSQEASCRQLKPQAEWIAIPVPALVEQATFDQARAQLARNAALSFRHNTRRTYPLRCLLTCGTCGLAMFGVTRRGHAQPELRYYQCNGKDPVLSARARRCPRRAVRADELEAVVWEHLAQLLADPRRLLTQFEQYARAAADGDVQEQAERQHLEQRIARLGREEQRLLDAYQAEVISLDELAERRALVDQRRRGLRAQREQWARLRQERLQAREVLRSLTAFCARIGSRLAEATVQEQQALLQLLVERIIVRDDALEIRHVIPLGNAGPAPPEPDPTEAGLRSDGVHPTALPARPDEHLLDRLLEPRVRIADDQLHPPHPAPDQVLQECPPQGHVLAEADVQAQHFPHPVRPHPVGDDHRLGDDVPALADVLVARIEPQVRVVGIQPAGAEGGRLLVEAGA